MSYERYFAGQVRVQKEAGREFASQMASIALEALTNPGPGVSIRLGMAIDRVNLMISSPELAYFYSDSDLTALIANSSRLLKYIRAKEKNT